MHKPRKVSIVSDDFRYHTISSNPIIDTGVNIDELVPPFRSLDSKNNIASIMFAKVLILLCGKPLTKKGVLKEGVLAHPLTRRAMF